MSSVEHPEGASLLPTRQINEASNAVQKSRPDFLLWCCRVFNLITGICALLCAVALSIAIGLQAGSVRKVHCKVATAVAVFEAKRNSFNSSTNFIFLAGGVRVFRTSFASFWSADCWSARLSRNRVEESTTILSTSGFLVRTRCDPGVDEKENFTELFSCGTSKVPRRPYFPAPTFFRFLKPCLRIEKQFLRGVQIFTNHCSFIAQ